MGAMNTARINAYAKVNLTLDIVGQEEGYHLLDSLVVTVDLADRIVLKRRKDPLSQVAMHGMGSEQIPPEENNALRAAEAFSARFQTDGANIAVYKNIPMGAGLGGSSADAAGVLLGMAKLYDIADMGGVFSLAEELGSDVKFQISGGFARMRGRGERLQFYPDVPEMWLLLAYGKEGVSTAACYKKFDARGENFAPRTERALEGFASGNLEWAARLFGNHLTAAATELLPEIGETLKALGALSPIGCGMTGSGSAAYAVFPTRELALWAQSRFEGKGRTAVLCAVDPKKMKKLRNPYALDEDEGERS